jgi:hypothetical protein
MTSSCASLCLLLVSACSLNNPGVDPPKGVLSYPVALSFREPSAAKHDVLYVANSNFDLRYNAASLQVYDLNKLEKAVTRDDCRESGLSEQRLQFADGGPEDGGEPNTDASVNDAGGPLSSDVPLPSDYEEGAVNRGVAAVSCDGRAGEPCCFRSKDFLLAGKGRSEILIDSFASGLAVAPDGRRIYVPVRSRDRLLYVDVDAAGQISCGDDDGRCTRGTVPSDKDKDPLAKLEPQPTAMVVGALDTMVDGKPKGTFLATAHEGGGVGFFVDSGDGPVLHSSAYAANGRLTSITADARNQVFYLTTGQRSTLLSRFGLRDLDKRYALAASPSLMLDNVAAPGDTRDIALDPDDPTRLIVLMRGHAESVPSVLFMRLDPTDATSGMKLEGQVHVGAGPSRLTQATIDGRRVLFVSCYDERAIYVIDEQKRRLERIIRGFAGPFEMLADEARGLLYVADFSVSVVRVVDIRGVFNVQLPPPRIIATLGKVRTAEGLQ